MAPDPAAAPERPAPVAPRFDITALRFVFDAVEDRLRAEAMDAAGRSQAIWLTRRMADAMIVALAKQVDRLPRAVAEPVPSVGVPETSSRLSPPGSHPQSAVASPRAASVTRHAWLCRQGRFRPRADGLLIELRGPAGMIAHLTLSRFAIQAMLLLLLTAYRRAQWPLAPFPAALRAAEAAPPVPREKLH